eukprot:12095764-Prorocentrum_lima.AAC.1
MGGIAGQRPPQPLDALGEVSAKAPVASGHLGCENGPYASTSLGADVYFSSSLSSGMGGTVGSRPPQPLVSKRE